MMKVGLMLAGTAFGALAFGSAQAQIAAPPPINSMVPGTQATTETPPVGAEASVTSTPQGQAQAPAATNGSQLEDIVVTAQRSRENSQSVPIAITALNTRALQASGVTGTVDLPRAVPGLTFNSQALAAQPFLRGIGTNNVALGDENVVALYVDGVYRSAPIGSLFSFSNIDQIEVDKGPQGTLFGRNAIGGVIQITTKDPQFAPAADLRTGYGSYNTITESLYATTGITDNVAISVSANYNDQRDGWGKNLFNGRDVYLGKEFNIRGKLLWNIDSRTTLKIAADYNYLRNDFNASESPLPPSRPLPPYYNLDKGGFYDINADLVSSGMARQRGVEGTLNHDFGWSQFSAISAFRATNGVSFIDQDVSPLHGTGINSISEVRTFTQELQLKSPTASTIKWVGGLYFYHDISGYPNFGSRVIDTGRPTPQEASRIATSLQRSNSYAAFGQATAPIFAQIHLTLGLRYTLDDREAFYQGLSAPVGGQLTPIVGNPADQSTSFRKLTYRVALDRKFGSNVLGYLSYNRGFKSGLYNLQSPFAPGTTVFDSAHLQPVRPETLDAYEAGLKTDLFDRHVRFNVAAFYYNFTDIQVAQTFPGGAFLQNAASAHVKGADAELEVIPVRNLRLKAAGSYVDAKFVDFPGAAITGINAAGNTVSLGTANVGGNYIPQAPKFTGTLSGDYTIETSIGNFVVDGSYYYNDGFFWQPENRVRQPAYHLMTTGLNWISPSKRFEARVFVRNLTDEKYFTLGGVGVPYADRYSPGAPRTIGGTLTLHLK